MIRSDNEDNRAVALYWDFENLHASLVEARYGEGYYAKPDSRFKVQEPLVDIQAIVELSASFGPIAINRAYGNWQYFGRYRDALLQCAVELIQLFPPGASAKNGADIKLCLDATEDISRFGHIGTVLIVGGDSDFMPVAQKIKAAGRTLIGIGSRRTTNRHWAKSCHEFRYYDNLVEQPPSLVDGQGDVTPFSGPSYPTPSTTGQRPSFSLAPADDTATNGPGSRAPMPADLLRRAMRLLGDTQGDPWVNKATVWHMIKRLDPTFDPKDHGFIDFSDMLRVLDAMVEVRKGESDHRVRLR